MRTPSDDSNIGRWGFPHQSPAAKFLSWPSRCVLTANESVQYYSYTVDSPYAKNGTHNLAVATAKDNAVYLFVVSANDKQWSTNEKVLRTIQQSFIV